ncbi:HlyD family secretion protein [Pilibacter termitis]|uniref:HlyD family secretion protein n=1 Tax=Pilibacter termitis TaxID=263852 RepID=A0A1T4QVC0_9ENTE|nr:HlyD family efflux transporter periplasmic adaptor subunit [Pilibacter termitis]SKA07719.1 HlyD family secretion protein [Pilibacter termitis]
MKQTESKLLTLCATKDGAVHYLLPLKAGLGLQAFQPVAQMDKGKSSKLVAEVFISAQDRSKLKLGNETKLAISGVNQTKFGLLNGRVRNISDGTISQDRGSESQILYQVIIELDKTSLKSESEEILAKPSMPVIASIVYENENYLDWVLEQLNFLKEK